MKERDIDEIIISILKERGTEEEYTALNKWLAESDKHLRTFEHLKLIWKEKSARPKVPNSDQLADKIWAKATNQYVLREDKPEQKNRWKRYLGIAAAVSALVIISILLVRNEFYIQNDNTYTSRIIERSTLAGQKLRITLPDSSIVWINSESSIKYSEHFTAKDRIVALKGEAYFEVKKDPARTFEVLAGDLTVKALGTSFNVNAFNSEKKIKVALVEGKVGIVNKEALTVLLNAGELAVYNTTQKVFRKARTSLQDEVSWKDGRMVFRNADFDTVIAQLERWYGVKFFYDEKVKPDWDFTANFTDSNLENVLKVIGFGEGFQFKIDGDSVTLYF